MSQTLDPAAAATGHGHGHGHGHHDDGHDDITLRGYLIGLGLSVLLTAIPFWLVMQDVLSSSTATAIAVLVLGGVQVVVHMVYFLHMNTRSEGGWNMLALIFTAVMLVIILAGSMWVMHHLNTNMMPLHVSPLEMRNMP